MTWKIRETWRGKKPDFIRVWADGKAQEQHAIFPTWEDAQAMCKLLARPLLTAGLVEVVRVWEKPTVTELHGRAAFHARLSVER